MPFQTTIIKLAAAIIGVGSNVPAAIATPLPPVVVLRELDERVLTVGHRLAVGAVQLCSRRQWHPGFAIHDLSQYPRSGHAEAARLFGLRRGPAVLAVVQGAPAEQAGLRRDDILIEADHQPLPRAPQDAENDFLPTERIMDALDTAFADGTARLTAARGNGRVTISVTARLGCFSRFQVIPSTELNAKADGTYVQLTSAIAQLAGDEDELAAMIAHELAHNILRHRARLDAAGIDRGRREHTGRTARLIRATEIEADRFAVYLLDRAGYDVRGAVRWWQRLGSRSAGVIPTGTHPEWRQRVASAQREIALIERARRLGRHAPPPFSS